MITIEDLGYEDFKFDEQGRVVITNVHINESLKKIYNRFNNESPEITFDDVEVNIKVKKIKIKF